MTTNTLADKDVITIQRFISNVRDVARPNRFLVTILDDDSGDDKLTYFCTKAIIPSMDVTGPVIKYKGTSLMLSGDVKKEPLQLTFLNVVGQDTLPARQTFETWINNIVEYSKLANSRGSLLTYLMGTSIIVQQLGSALTNESLPVSLATYEFHDCSPLEISAIDLDNSSNDTLSDFTVTFRYSRWELGEN